MKQIRHNPVVYGMTNQELNYCAAKLEGYRYIHVFHNQVMVSNKKHDSYDYNPCESPNRAYYIIVEFGIGTEQLDRHDADNGEMWFASTGSGDCYGGISPLHAAVRCYVAEHSTEAQIAEWMEEMRQGGNE